MNEEITQEMLLPIKEKKILSEAAKAIEIKKEVPIGFVPVNFISEDKLGPSVLHFRNYSMEELLELSMSTEENRFSTLINKCLSKMNYEHYDCSLLHSEHIIQIMMTIYMNFWGTKLYSMPYYEDEENQTNIKYEDIDLSLLKEIKLSDKFKEPFTIVDDITKKKIKFTLPKVNSVFLAEEYVNKKYKEEDEKFSSLKSTLNLIEQLKNTGDSEQMKRADLIKVDYELKKEYDLMQEEKMKDYLRVIQSQLIHSIDGQELKTIEEKIDAYKNRIDATAWTRYKTVVQDYGTFGIDPNYTFTVDTNNLTRRFSFRYLDFIPSMEQKTDTGYSVQFDD
jgi:hypothetical protein